MSCRQVTIPLGAEQLRTIDRARLAVAESRSRFIAEACRELRRSRRRVRAGLGASEAGARKVAVSLPEDVIAWAKAVASKLAAEADAEVSPSNRSRSATGRKFYTALRAAAIARALNTREML